MEKERLPYINKTYLKLKLKKKGKKNRLTIIHPPFQLEKTKRDTRARIQSHNKTSS